MTKSEIHQTMMQKMHTPYFQNSSNEVQKIIDLQSIPKSPRRSLKSPGAPLKFPLLSRNYVIEESDFSSAQRCNFKKNRPVFIAIDSIELIDGIQWYFVTKIVLTYWEKTMF